MALPIPRDEPVIPATQLISVVISSELRAFPPEAMVALDILCKVHKITTLAKYN